jgi:hypothetical protein
VVRWHGKEYGALLPRKRRQLARDDAAYERALFRFARAVGFDLARSRRGAAAHTAVLSSALAALRIEDRLRRGLVPDPGDERIVLLPPGPRPSPAELSLLARVLTLRGLGEKDRLRRPRQGLERGVERPWTARQLEQFLAINRARRAGIDTDAGLRRSLVQAGLVRKTITRQGFKKLLRKLAL